MALDFPSNPVNGQIYGTYTYDSSVPGWRSTPDVATGMPAGSIMAWGTDTPPSNWLICNGAAVSRTTYASLFAAIGVSYGVGDGATTFNLPDFRGKVPVGKDATQAEFDTIAETGGSKTTAKYGDGTTTGYGAIYSSSLGSGDATGSNLPPYQVVNYIIKFSAGVSAGDSDLATRVGVIENKFNTGQNDTPAGAIMPWAAAAAPTNWLLCDGSAVSRAAWPSLFAVIGTTYGAGDGSTTFNVPDLRGRVAVGKNAATFGTLGATGGSETHRHDFKFSLLDSGNYGVSGPNAGMGSGTGSAGAFRYSSSTWVGGSSNGSITATGENANATSSRTLGRYESIGDTDLGSSIQPYQVVNYIIKATAGVSTNDSTFVTRVGAVETRVGAEEVLSAGLNKSGLVPIVPTSVSVGSGTATVATDGTITFSGASGVSIDGVFSATYRNYRLMTDATSVNNAIYLWQGRVGGTTTTGNNYYYNELYASAGSVGASGNGPSGGTTNGRIGYMEAGTYTSLSVDIYSPQLATQTQSFSTQGRLSAGTTPVLVTNTGGCQLTTQFTGLYVSPSAGTFSGTLKFYGYR